MNVLVVEPGYLPYEKEINGLEEMQAVVGGLIAPIYPYEDSVALVGNDEALLIGLPFNRSVPAGYGGLFGTFFICGLGEDDFVSLTPEQVKFFKNEFKNAEVLLGVRGDNDMVTIKFPAKEKPAGQPEHEKNEHER